MAEDRAELRADALLDTVELIAEDALLDTAELIPEDALLEAPELNADDTLLDFAEENALLKAEETTRQELPQTGMDAPSVDTHCALVSHWYPVHLHVSPSTTHEV